MKKSCHRGIIAALFILTLSHCSQRKPVDFSDSDQEIEPVIQLAPEEPEAVQMLIAEADTHLASGSTNQAILTLKRALSISPDSASVQQHLAEIYLSDGAYQDAFDWSNQVVEHGPSQGSLCERARQTLALAAEMLGDTVTQGRALEAIEKCYSVRPTKY